MTKTMSTPSEKLSDPTRDEIDSLHRRVDQFVTAHSILRDSYQRRSRIINALAVFSSTIVTLIALTSTEIKNAVIPTNVNPNYLLSLFAFATLILTLIELYFRWGDTATKHGETANAFSRIKLKIGSDSQRDIFTSEEIKDFNATYDNICDTSIKLSDSQFLKMKAAHKRKIEISQHLDNFPYAFVPILRAKSWLRDNIGWPN